jgi:hypothetical protein
MKANAPSDKDPALGGVLKEWQVNASLPPRFQERVWERIALAEAPAPAKNRLAAFAAWVQGLLVRPGMAAGSLAAILAVGFVLGWTRGMEKKASMEEGLSSRYVQVIDPYHNH